MPGTSPTPRVASCPPALTSRQPRPRAGSPSAAAWLPAPRPAGWLPPSTLPRPPSLLPATGRRPPRHRSPYQPGAASMGSATGDTVRAAGQHRLGRLRQPLQPEEEEEEEEQVKEMIDFLFLLKLSNRISGAAGQARRESSWQGGNPRKRALQECGGAQGVNQTLLGVRGFPPHTHWVGVPGTAGPLAPAWCGQRDTA